MGKETVTVTINEKTGTASFECNGFTGEGCDIINKLEESIAANGSMKRTDKDERYTYIIPESVQNFI